MLGFPETILDVRCCGHLQRWQSFGRRGRDDLIRLLDSFPQEERPGAMSVRRLREALGL